MRSVHRGRRWAMAVPGPLMGITQRPSLLGSQVIEGVRAESRVTVLRFPPSSIGNALPSEIVSSVALA